MPTLEALCARGYLPKELPPQFSSTTLGQFLAASGGALPAQIQGHARVAETAVHSLARHGVQRRELGIPNPVWFSKLAHCLVTEWPAVLAAVSVSPFSATTPADRNAPSRPMDRSDAFQNRSRLRARIRSTARYLVTADVSRFYHSLYTHSIPWALHTKPVAKARKNDPALLGNRIDKFVREGQDRQTLGIPVGPDTSLVLAEIILTQVDRALEAKGFANAFRIIDDYEIGTMTLGEAERAVATLQAFLREFELDLNGAKTAIRELPLPHDSPWVRHVSRFAIPPSPEAQIRVLLGFFDRAYELARQYPEDSIIAFAVRTAASLDFDHAVWECYEQILLQCALVESGCLRHVVSELDRLVTNGHRLDLLRLEAVLNDIIIRHAPLGHGSEVAWGITGLLRFGRPLNTAVCREVASTTDPVVALPFLDAVQRGLVATAPDLTSLASVMTTDELYGSQWLLSYEANMKGWLPSVGMVDHVQADASFATLKAAGVSFYDPTAVAIPIPRLPYAGDYMGGTYAG
jgi:Reverse transcriptase (RNA-dependent DNA polymerase)